MAAVAGTVGVEVLGNDTSLGAKHHWRCGRRVGSGGTRGGNDISQCRV